MHSPLPDDRTARARIRDEALRLVAERGPDAVTLRDIANAAGVSPALLIRHYGSKDGLVEIVANHVVAIFEVLLTTMPEHTAVVGLEPPEVPSLLEGAKGVQLAECAYASSRERRWVEVPPLEP